MQPLFDAAVIVVVNLFTSIKNSWERYSSRHAGGGGGGGGGSRGVEGGGGKGGGYLSKQSGFCWNVQIVHNSNGDQSRSYWLE